MMYYLDNEVGEYPILILYNSYRSHKSISNAKNTYTIILILSLSFFVGICFTKVGTNMLLIITTRDII